MPGFDRTRVEGQLGLHWILELYPLPMRERGWCSAPHEAVRQIRVASNLPLPELVEVVIHEVTHAVAWDLSEEAVTQIGEEASKAVLWALRKRGLLE